MAEWHSNIVGWFLTGWFSPPGFLSDLFGRHLRSKYSSTLNKTSKYSSTLDKTSKYSSTLSIIGGSTLLTLD